MISAKDIAALSGTEAPTPEQEAVIEAPLEGVYRVMAGAGSGKTETMAQRVIWLVANGYVSPTGVLGLTFTKKAAAELGKRIALRLGALRDHGIGEALDEFDAPQVSTYHSFASAVYRDNAVVLGMDPDATVLSEASAWGLARSVIRSSTLPALADWDYSLDELTRVVRLLAQRVSDNHVTPEIISSFVSDFRALGELPPGGRGQYADVDSWVKTVGTLETLMVLVGDYTRAKRVRGVIEFSDQVALASEIIASHPHVIERYRSEHQVVLLDEYQDTSVSQTSLLRALFEHHPVMAVGDPHQAIYAWRGASSANLAQFENDFGASVATFSLSVSWRNGTTILEAANHLATPLRDSSAPEVGILRAGPNASSHPLELSWSHTVEEEAKEVAAWCAGVVKTPGVDGPPSAALLLRARAHQRIFVEALHAEGVPVHILGIGGLLEDPVIADIVCVLRVIASPTAESELVRLLAGGKWRIGVADIYRVSRVRRWLGNRDEHGVVLEEEIAKALSTSVSDKDTPSLWDALSFLVSTPSSHTLRKDFAPETLERLSDVHRTVQVLARGRSGDLVELVHQIEQSLCLDIELLSHPQRDRYLAARETFFEALYSYTSIADDPSVAGFVQWLDEAQRRDNLTPRSEKAEPGCVQVLTIHGAKGLEWDAVAIPRLVEDEMPAAPRETKGWLYRGELPYPLRGDASSLPHLPFREATTRKELVDMVGRFQEDNRSHRLAEERRLMYVAMTRAKHRVLLSGSFFAHHTSHRGPSVFLRELSDAGLINPVPLHPEDPTPPVREAQSSRVWPGDPLGTRRPLIERAAELVKSALDNPPTAPEDPHLRVVVGGEVRSDPSTELIPRRRVSASALEAMAGSAEDYRLRVLRPVPRQPVRAALRGTQFHAWVENHFEQRVPTALVDMEAEASEDDVISVDELIRGFESSEFAHRQPLAIEAELHMPLRDVVVVCKIDAVFPEGTGVHIVDWKTGAPPTRQEDLERKSLQLAAYRLAWSTWTGLSLDEITASFWFATTGSLVTPRHFASADQLWEIIRRSVGSTGRVDASER